MQAKSLGDMLRTTAARFPDKPAMLLPGKDSLGEITYSQLLDRVRGYCGALRSLGIERGDRVSLLSDNCAEWAIADWACCCLGVVTVPIYATLPADQTQHIVSDSGSKLVLTGGPEHQQKVQHMDGVRSLLLRGEGSLDTMAILADAALTVEELHSEIDLTGLEDLFTIIYTSGTTGVPKGAMLPHRASIHVCEYVKQNLPFNEKEVFLTFLPMSHVYERIAGQHLPICLGATVAYAKSLASLAGDMAKVRPTIMLCVPRFLEAFREKALDAISKAPPLRQKLFALALTQGVKKAKGQFAPLAGLLDKIVMSKLRERTGGRLRYFVSGGAALASHVAEFYMATGMTVLQGYGLTETAGGTCVNHPDRNKYWTVGEPLDMEVQIAQDGEILVRGPALMLGYYNQPEETAAAIDTDGWFHTGDIGEFEGAHLKITDRKKDLIVLGNGKNVAPQPIENKLSESPYIQEAVLFGDGMEHLVALIVPNFEAVRKELNLAEAAPVSDDPQAKALIKKEIDRINKSMASFEMVKKHTLLSQAFSIESGEMTPTLKIKRRVVREKYAQQIAAMR